MQRINTQDELDLHVKIMDKSPNMIFIKDARGKFRMANRLLCEIIGLKRKDILGRTDRELNLLDDEVSGFERIDQQVIKEGKAIGPFEEEVTAQGNTIWFKTIKMPIRVDGETMVLGISSEITREKQQEEYLKSANEELERFLYHASHDLRGPVATMAGLLDLMKRMPPSREESVLYLEHIEMLNGRMDGVIRKLLASRRILAHEVQYTQVRIYPLVLEAFRTVCKMEGREPHINLHFSEDMLLELDPFLMREIFEALVENSLRHAGKRTEELQINVSINEPEKGFLELAFCDNGKGTQEKHLSKLTNMFYKSTNDPDGSGLGLYIVHTAVKQMGGKLNLSIINPGFCVEMRFPV